MSDNKTDSRFKNDMKLMQKADKDSILTRRDALKRAAKQVLGLAGLFTALPAISTAAKSGHKQTEVQENNYYNYYNYYSYNTPGAGYYSYYCEDYYGYIYNQPGAPYQTYQGYWEKIYSSYCSGYYSYSKTDSIPDKDYFSYLNTDSIQYSSYWSGK